jgi:hypothetical protein
MLGWLLHRSGAGPRWLGPLLALAGVGYLVDSSWAVLTGDSSPVMSMYTFVGEFALAVWLVVHGRSRTTSRVTARGDAHTPLLRVHGSAAATAVRQDG